jgi:hypothetical protein
MNETLLNEVRRLWETEKLSQRQIAEQLGLGRRRVAAFLGGADRKPRAPTVVEPYERLIAEWYAATPSLRRSRRCGGCEATGSRAGTRW